MLYTASNPERQQQWDDVEIGLLMISMGLRLRVRV
jgi:hypothetical protein